MTNLENISTHNFFHKLMEDSKFISKGRNYNIFDIELEEPNYNEYEYYIHYTGFYFVHLLRLCEQLENSIDLLSNYNYKKINKVNRGEHIIYNVENYIIRLSSLSDRTLQLINATFHLGIDEKHVNEKVILNNIKVSRTNVTKLFNDFRKVLSNYTAERNTIIHKHSYLDKQLKRIEIFYNPCFQNIMSNSSKATDFKEIIREELGFFLKEKKKEYDQVNETCFEKISPIFDELLKHYNKTKEKLK